MGIVITYATDSFGVENTPKWIKKFKDKKNVTNKRFNNCGYTCTGFINFILKVKHFLSYINLFYLENMKKLIK